MKDRDVEAKENYLLNISLGNLLKGGSLGLTEVPSLIKKVIDREVWKSIYIQPTGQYVSFRNIREWIEADMPEGLASDVSTVEILLKLSPETLLRFREVLAEKHYRAISQAPAIVKDWFFKGFISQTNAASFGKLNLSREEQSQNDYIIAEISRFIESQPEPVDKKQAKALGRKVNKKIRDLRGLKECRITGTTTPENAAVVLSQSFDKVYIKQLAEALLNIASTN